MHPAGGDDRRALLGALEVVARGGVQHIEVGRTEAGHGVPLQLGPQVLHWIEVGRVRGREGNLDMTVHAVQVIASQPTAMRLQAIPDDQQRLSKVRLDSLKKLDDLFFLDATFVQAEQAPRSSPPALQMGT